LGGFFSFPPLEQADAEFRPTYLESSAMVNNDYYRKFGFELRRDVVLQRGLAPVTLSIMVREPQLRRGYHPAAAVAAVGVRVQQQQQQHGRKV